VVDKLFVATKAFIKYQGKVLILKESEKYGDGTNAGKFDLVGGRIKPGEHFATSLKREVKEETGLEITIKEPFFVSEWRPQVNGEDWQIVGIFFRCEANNDKVVLSDDHNEHIWIDPKDYNDYSLIDNLVPAFQEYLKTQ